MQKQELNRTLPIIDTIWIVLIAFRSPPGGFFAFVRRHCRKTPYGRMTWKEWVSLKTWLPAVMVTEKM